MKVNMNTCAMKRYADLEEGEDDKRLHIYLQKPTKCAALLNGVKFVLCLELIILVGWLGFMAIDSYVERYEYKSQMDDYEFTDAPIGIDDTSDLETTTIATTEWPAMSTNEVTEGDDDFRLKTMPSIVIEGPTGPPPIQSITKSPVESVDRDQKSSESPDESVAVKNTPFINYDILNYDYSERDDYLNSFPNINASAEDNEKEMAPSVTECGYGELSSTLQPDGRYGAERRCIPMELWIQYLRARTLSEMPWFPTSLEDSEFSSLPPSEIIDYL